jgi:hypothetical protein
VTLPAVYADATDDMPGLLGGLAAQAGLADAAVRGPGVAATLAAIGERLGTLFNRDIGFRDGEEPLGPASLVAVASERRLRPPRHLSDVPEGFGPATHEALSPAVRLLSVPDGYLVPFGNAPVVLSGNGREVLRRYSSRYAPMLHLLDIDLGRLRDAAIEVGGPLLVLGDDVRPSNYCHWLVDWLPRLALLDGRVDRAALHVAVPPIDAPYQRELLARCGIDAARIVELMPMRAVRARTQFVTSDLPAPPPPAFKAAPWALRFLRRTLAPPPAAATGPRRLYVSRGDAAGRRLLNETALAPLLERAGFVKVTPGGLSVAGQAALFAGASDILAPHGAALANIVFAPPGARLLELFPASYGTAAYYVLAAAAGIDYASYVTHDVVSGSRTQLDDLRVDMADALARWSGRAAGGA